jgi:hypothetical protein
MKVGEGEGGSAVNKKTVVEEDNSHPLFQGDKTSTITKIPVGQTVADQKQVDHDGKPSLRDTADLTPLSATEADVPKATVVMTSSKEQDSNPEKSDCASTVPSVGGSGGAITKGVAHVDLLAPTNGTHKQAPKNILGDENLPHIESVMDTPSPNRPRGGLVPTRIGRNGQDKSQDAPREENGARNSLVKLVVKSFKRVGKDKRRQDGSLVEVSVFDVTRDCSFPTLLETSFFRELTCSFVLQGSNTDTVNQEGDKVAKEGRTGTNEEDKIALDSDLGETLGRTHEILVSLASSSEVEMSELLTPRTGLKIDQTLDYYRKMRSAPSSGSETIQTNNTTDGREWAEVILTHYVASNPCYCFVADTTAKLQPQSNAASVDLPCSSPDALVVTDQALEAGSCLSEESAATRVGPISHPEQKVSWSHSEESLLSSFIQPQLTTLSSVVRPRAVPERPREPRFERTRSDNL